MVEELRDDGVEHDEGGSGCCARGYCGPQRQAQVLGRLASPAMPFCLTCPDRDQAKPVRERVQ